MPLPRSQLVQELLAIALGTAFNGKALRQAKTIPELSAADCEVLDRWLIGSQIGNDWRELQVIANKIANSLT